MFHIFRKECSFYKRFLLERTKFNLKNGVTLSCKGLVLLRQEYSSLSSDEMKYLHPISKVDTFHYQESLPRLPIPKLDETCKKYLSSQKAVLTQDEYDSCRKYVEKFKIQEGPGLQKQLIEMDKANKHTSYITDMWFDMYLMDRRPLVLTHNPFICYNDDPNPLNNQQLVRATNMIISSVRFRNSLENLVLEPDVYHLKPKRSDTEWFKNIIRYVPTKFSWYGAYLVKAFPLDMSQYYRLFNSSRIPQFKKDKLVTHSGANHIVIMHNGNFYIFDVADSNGCLLSPVEIYSNLNYIMSNPAPVPASPIGYLTSENRDTWAELRKSLESDPVNAKSLKLIDSALFALCLDDVEIEDPRSASGNFLHGNGLNRWFDKSFSLIVCKDGKACVNFEHAWGDGVAVMRYFLEVYKDSTTRPMCSISMPTDQVTGVHKLDFNLTPDVSRGVQQAKEKFEKKVATLNFSTRDEREFGKDFLKKLKISPDAVMQLAFQMGYYRLTGHFTATYESCSTAAFKHGRTETIRPATNATVSCCEAFQKTHYADVEEMTKRIKQCSDVHNNLTKNAAMGKGWDRHLFALRHLAEEAGLKPGIFQDPSYTSINHNTISTSTLANNPAILLGGFAPVVPDGYGLGYMIYDDFLGVNCTSYPDSLNVDDFTDCIMSSLHDIYSVLLGKNFKDKM